MTPQQFPATPKPGSRRAARSGTKRAARDSPELPDSPRTPDGGGIGVLGRMVNSVASISRWKRPRISMDVADSSAIMTAVKAPEGSAASTPGGESENDKREQLSKMNLDKERLGGSSLAAPEGHNGQFNGKNNGQTIGQNNGQTFGRNNGQTIGQFNGQNKSVRIAGSPFHHSREPVQFSLGSTPKLKGVRGRKATPARRAFGQPRGASSDASALRTSAAVKPSGTPAQQRLPVQSALSRTGYQRHAIGKGRRPKNSLLTGGSLFRPRQKPLLVGVVGVYTANGGGEAQEANRSLLSQSVADQILREKRNSLFRNSATRRETGLFGGAPSGSENGNSARTFAEEAKQYERTAKSGPIVRMNRILGTGQTGGSWFSVNRRTSDTATEPQNVAGDVPNATEPLDPPVGSVAKEKQLQNKPPASLASSTASNASSKVDGAVSADCADSPLQKSLSSSSDSDDDEDDDDDNDDHSEFRFPKFPVKKVWKGKLPDPTPPKDLEPFYSRRSPVLSEDEQMIKNFEIIIPMTECPKRRDAFIETAKRKFPSAFTREKIDSLLDVAIPTSPETDSASSDGSTTLPSTCAKSELDPELVAYAESRMIEKLEDSIPTEQNPEKRAKLIEHAMRRFPSEFTRDKIDCLVAMSIPTRTDEELLELHNSPSSEITCSREIMIDKMENLICNETCRKKRACIIDFAKHRFPSVFNEKKINSLLTKAVPTISSPEATPASRGTGASLPFTFPQTTSSPASRGASASLPFTFPQTTSSTKRSTDKDSAKSAKLFATSFKSTASTATIGASAKKSDALTINNKTADAKPAALAYTDNTTADTTPAAPVASGWGNLFDRKPGEWKCSVCSVKNPKEATKCLACEAAKPAASVGAPASAPVSEPASAPVASGWGNLFDRKPGEWKCSACSVKNPKEATKCLACETAKPGDADSGTKPTTSSGMTFGAGLDVKKSKDEKPSGFSFGKDTSSMGSIGSGGFSFGKDESSSKSSPKKLGLEKGSDGDEVKSTGFTFGNTVASSSTAGGFNFAASTPAAPAPAPAASTPSAPPPAASAPVAPTPVAPALASVAPAPASNAGFTFGSTTPAATNGEMRSKKKRTKRGLPDATDESVSATNSTVPAPTAKPADAAPFSFGGNASSSSLEKRGSASGGFSFGAADKKTNSESEAQTTTTTNKGFAFGSMAPAPAEEKATSVKPPVLSFGAKPEGSEATSNASKPNSAPAPSFAFGSAASAPSKVFQFGSSSSTPAPSAGTTTAQPPFGSVAPQPTPSISSQSPPPPSTTLTTPLAPAFSFGTGATPAPAPSAGFQFGNSSSATPAPASGTGFTFVAGSAATTPAPATGNTFGSSAPPNAGGPAPSFTFGTATPAPAPGLFTFGSAATPAAATSTFGSNAPPSQPIAAPTASAHQFGAGAAPMSAPGFGTPAPSGFGAPAPAVSGFGMTPAAPPAVPAFGFGAAATPASSTSFGGAFGATNAPAPSAMGGTPGGFNIGSAGTKKTPGGRRIVKARRPPGSSSRPPIA